MAAKRSFETMEVWNDSHSLITGVFRATKSDLMKREYFLQDQLKKSALSILSNISEGFERDGNKELIQYLSQAKGSVGELRAQLLAGSDMGLLSPDDFKHLHNKAISISRQLSGFIRYLKESRMKGRKFES